MNVGEHAKAVVASAEVQRALDEGVGVLVVVSSLTPAVGGGTAVIGSPRVGEAELVMMLERLVAEMHKGIRARNVAARKPPRSGTH